MNHIGMIAAVLWGAAAMLHPAAEELPAPESGGRETGWRTEENRRFYTLADGTDAVGETEIEGVSYLFAPNGVQQLGWQTVGGLRYFYDPLTGEPQFGRIRWRGADYYITPEGGKAAGGLVTVPEGAVFADSEGVLQTGWQETDGAKRYFGDTGIMQTGVILLNDGYCDFGDDGILRTGLCSTDTGELFFRNADGTPYSGFYTDKASGKTYYFGENGLALRGLQTLDDALYSFGEDSAMQTGWQESDGIRRYFSADGRGAKGLYAIDGKAYYFDSDGALLTGTAADSIKAVGEARLCFKDDGTLRFGFEPVGDTLRYMSEYGYITEENIRDKTNLGLAYYAICKLGSPFWYSTHGEIASQELLDELSSMFWGYYCSWNDYDQQFGQQVFDCAGLITAYRAAETVDSIPEGADKIWRSAEGYYKDSDLHDKIDTCPWTIGTLLFRADPWVSNEYGIHHAGIYIGNGMVVEAKGHEWGVILSTNLDFWTHWAQCRYTPDTPQHTFEQKDNVLACYDRSGAEIFRYETEGDTLRYSEPDGTAKEVSLSAKTPIGLAYYAIQKIGCPYWQGCYGQIASKALWDTFYQYAPVNYTRWNDYESQYGQQVFDCIGLVKAYLWCKTVNSAPVVNWDQAVNESTMYDICPEHGTIETCPWTVGMLVFRAYEDSTRPNKIHHVGVYIGHGMVVEAKGHNFGVVLTTNQERWTHWANCLWLTP